jgi:hypothetical protein
MSIACSRVLSLVVGLASVACSSSDAPATLVRFGQTRPVSRWNITESADAALAAEVPDSSASSDGGEPDAELASIDASMDGADADADEDDAGVSSEAEPISACTFRVTTQSQAGRYAPKNVGAIWIERDGKWVETLRVWAGVRLRYLTTYLEANSERNTVDAMTSATVRQHGMQEARWNLKDAAGEPAPDGDYVLRLEVTDRPSMGRVLDVRFKKGAEPLLLKPEDTEFFTAMELSCS